MIWLRTHCKRFEQTDIQSKTVMAILLKSLSWFPVFWDIPWENIYVPDRREQLYAYPIWQWSNTFKVVCGQHSYVMTQCCLQQYHLKEFSLQSSGIAKNCRWNVSAHKMSYLWATLLWVSCHSLLRIDPTQTSQVVGAFQIESPVIRSQSGWRGGGDVKYWVITMFSISCRMQGMWRKWIGARWGYGYPATNTKYHVWIDVSSITIQLSTHYIVWRVFVCITQHIT